MRIFDRISSRIIDCHGGKNFVTLGYSDKFIWTPNYVSPVSEWGIGPYGDFSEIFKQDWEFFGWFQGE